MPAVATLVIEPIAAGLRLRLDVPERDHAEPLQREFRHFIDVETLQALADSSAAFFQRGARPTFEQDARSCGAMLYRTLIPEALRPDLARMRGPLVVATSLGGIPWELVHDDEEFWGLRYALGKRILLDRPAAARRGAVQHVRVRALVIGADPRADLPFVTSEIGAVCDALEARVDVTCVTDRLATVDRVLALLGEGFDLVHYAGHVVTDDAGAPALLLADGARLPASVIEANLAGRPLVFVNGCASAGGARSVDSVADAFVRGGALAVVGTTGPIVDEHAATLATTFYQEALGGAPLGIALREARAHVREHAPTSPAWLGFTLYGNPALVVARGAPPKVVALETRGATPEIQGDASPGMRRRPWRFVGLLALLAVLGVLARSYWMAPAAPLAVGVVEVRARGRNVPEWMRVMTRDSLNTVLARVATVRVYSRQKIDFLREKRGLGEIEAAEALGMSKMLSATVAVDGDTVTLGIEVVDIASGLLEATEQVRGPKAKLVSLQTELALRTLSVLGVPPSAEELHAIVAERRDDTVEAYRALAETLGATEAPPLPPPPPATVPGPAPTSHWFDLASPAHADAIDPDEAAIRDVLARYAAALGSERVDGVAALYVTMTEPQRASLARYFGIAERLQVEIRDVDILVDGADAVVTFLRMDSFTDAPSRRAMRLSVRVSGRFLREDGAWKIQSFGDRP